MIYEKYKTENIFYSDTVNALCDYIITKASEQTVLAIDDHFVLTGTPARIIQGDPSELIQCIPFITDDGNIFKYFRENIHTFSSFKSSVFFEEVLQCVFSFPQLNNDLYIEIWNFTGLLFETVNPGIGCQDINQISQNII